MFEPLYSAAPAPLRGWISMRAGTVERLIEEAQHGTGHVPFGAVGSVVRFNAEARRWVVVGTEAPDRVHLVALSGAVSSGESTNTPLRRLTRDIDQRITFTGTHARALEKKAKEAAGLRGVRLLSGTDAAVRQAPAPVTVAPRPERDALTATDFRQGAIRSKVAMHAALVPRPKADPTYQRQDAANAARLTVAFEALARAAEADEPFPRMTRLGDVRTSVQQRSPWIQTMVERYLPASADAYQGDGMALIRDLDRAIQVETVKRDVGNVEGYHPTPRGLAERVIALADIRPGVTVLEPSAGSGSLADAAQAAGGLVSVVERDPRLRRVLETKGYALIGDDALTVRGLFDRVVMNPPFERGAEIDHVRAAWENLAPGGRLVSIMSEGPFFRSDKKATAFRDWLESVRGASRSNEEGAFKGSERSTGVRTRIVVVDKPGDRRTNPVAPRKDEIPPGWYNARHEKKPGRKSRFLVHVDFYGGGEFQSKYQTETLDRARYHADHAKNAMQSYTAAYVTDEWAKPTPEIVYMTSPALRSNPAIARTRDTPAHLDSRRHFERLDVREAQRAVDAVLEGRGRLLGAGNFGAAFRVDLPTGPVVVKFGSRRTIHTRSPAELYAWVTNTWSQGGRSLKGAREEMIHEAGVSEALAGRHRVVPRIVYAEHKGRPALVREYGDIGPITPTEYDALSLDLAAVLADGWAVKDDLLIGRRPDGSLFVADIGVWRPFRVGDTHEPRDAWDDLDHLLGILSRDLPWSGGMEVPSAAHVRYWEEQIRTHEDDEDGFFSKRRLASAQRKLAECLTRRAAVGL